MSGSKPSSSGTEGVDDALTPTRGRDCRPLAITGEESDDAPAGGLGTRIANRFRGGKLVHPFEEIRGGSIRPLTT